jgi:hypothetical protein
MSFEGTIFVKKALVFEDIKNITSENGKKNYEKRNIFFRKY